MQFYSTGGWEQYIDASDASNLCYSSDTIPAYATGTIRYSSPIESERCEYCGRKAEGHEATCKGCGAPL